MTEAATTTAPFPPAEDAVRDLYGAGITACRGAFSPRWADRMREDIDAAFAEARGREGGAVGAARTAITWRSTPSSCAASWTWSTTPGCAR